MNLSRLFCLGLLASLLLACSSDVQLPPERPIGVVSGKVADGVVGGATVTIYAFGDGVRGRRLGGTTTDDDGNYSLQIQAPDQIILVEATGGSYIEQATGTTVTVPAGDVMQAMTPYVDGEDVDTVITPLTHLVAGLASYKVNQGMPAAQAYSEAKTTVEQFFSIDTSATTPIDITQAGDTVNALSDEALYGFYLAALSNWSLWAGNKNRVDPHTTYTSIGVLQVMYNDIQSDGVLDGVGYNLSRDSLMPLAIGVVPLDAEVYRAAFSLHLLAVSNTAGNTTNLKPGNLQSVAEDLAAKSSDLFANQTALDLNNQLPQISLPTPLQSAYSGVINMPVEIGGFLDAASVAVSVDGTFVTDVANPQNPELAIDTTLYPPDGDHVVSLTATDILGHSASQDVTFTFDNTNPVINVTSSAVTNNVLFTVSGTYSDNVAGVESIVVDGQPAALDQNGNWSATIDITPGENSVPISVFDFAANETQTQTTIFLDTIAPVIDTSNGHSDARFSNGSPGDFFTAPLQDNNAATALYIETDHLALNGTPVTRTDLDNNLIPYFAFSVSDDRNASDPTPFADLQVRMQYEKDGAVLSPWHTLPVPANGSEYLIPLASETLAANWHQASQDETHTIQLEVTDPAGNTTTTSFSFRTDFYVPPLDTTNLSTADLGVDIFATTAFTDRASLNDRPFASTQYAMIANPVDADIYIRPQDSAEHTVDQTVDQLVRVHEVRLITSTQWQIRLMTPTQQCPDQAPALWQTVATLYNWENGAWVAKTPPTPTLGPVEFAPDDNLPVAPLPTDWADAPDFDSEFNSRSITLSATQTLNYNFDYVLNTGLLPPAALVANWEIRDNNNAVVATCPDTSFFQQRQFFAYQSEPGYPQPVISQQQITNLPTFSTTGYAVFDVTANTLVQPVNGWYNIPAGHIFTVTKSVTTPGLTNYNDDISNPDVATYDPLFYDRSISWFVNREIVLSVIHNAGASKIPNMSQTMNPLGSGFMTYTISR